jgi:hypothetical protein
MTIKYSNNSDANKWLKDYNKDYPIVINDKKYKTLEHYLQCRIYYYSCTKNEKEIYENIMELECNDDYYDFLNTVNSMYVKKLSIDYNMLYCDYLQCRIFKVLQYPHLLTDLLNCDEDFQEVIQCENIDSLDTEELYKFKKSLMHINCYIINGHKKDPWNVIKDMFKEGRISVG